MRWCKWCSKPSNNGTQRVTGCLERKRRLQSTREPPVVVVAPSSHARATRGSEAASRATPTSASPPPQAERRPLRLADLPKTAPERRILEDPAPAPMGVGGADGENVDASMVVSSDELRRHLARSLAAHDA